MQHFTETELMTKMKAHQNERDWYNTKMGVNNKFFKNCCFALALTSLVEKRWITKLSGQQAKGGGH